MDISQSEIPLRRIRIPVSPLGFRLRAGPKPPVGAVSKMTNKPNLPRFWPKNADHPKKQTQSNPIAVGVLSLIERISGALALLVSQEVRDCPSAPAGKSLAFTAPLRRIEWVVSARFGPMKRKKAAVSGRLEHRWELK